MSTLFWVELVCGECSTTIAGTWTSGKVPVREMKKEAKEAGWNFLEKEAFCCEEHRAIWVQRRSAKTD